MVFLDWFIRVEICQKIIVPEHVQDGSFTIALLLSFQSRCLDPWQSKYCFRSKGLPLLQIQRYGFQILQVISAELDIIDSGHGW